MEAKLKKELGTTMLKSTGHSGGGCISEGQSYDTDNGRVFVKINHKSEVFHLLNILYRINVHECISSTSAVCATQNTPIRI